MLDFHVWIVQVEDQGKTRYTRILGWKFLIDTCSCIQHRLKLKIFLLIKQVINFRKVSWWELEIKDRSSGPSWTISRSSSTLWGYTAIFALGTYFAQCSSSRSLPQQCENWELEFYDRLLRSTYGWLHSTTVDDYLQ